MARTKNQAIAEEGELFSTHIGGAAALEGVMIRGKKSWAVAVRRGAAQVSADHAYVDNEPAGAASATTPSSPQAAAPEPPAAGPAIEGPATAAATATAVPDAAAPRCPRPNPTPQSPRSIWPSPPERTRFWASPCSWPSRSLRQTHC